MSDVSHGPQVNPCGLATRAGLAALANALDVVMDGVIGALHRAGLDASSVERAMADAADGLAHASAALELAGEHGLAVLLARLRARVIGSGTGGSAVSVPLHELARCLRSVLCTAFDQLLRGRATVAADLLPAWRMLSLPSDAGSADHAPLISLEHDIDARRSPVPVDELPSSLVAESERALLEFLRAADRDTRCAPLRFLAQAIVAVSVASAGSPACALWRVMQAYLLELAEDNVDSGRAKKILAALVRTLRHRDDASGREALASLARQVLFELSQTRPVTDAARDIVRAFRLEQQLRTSAAPLDEPPPKAPAASDLEFIRQLKQWLADRDMTGDGLGSAADLQALAAIAALSGSMAPLAAPLQQIAARLPTLQSEGVELWAAAAILCMHAWTADTARGRPQGEQIAALLTQAADSRPAIAREALETMIRLCDRLSPVRFLSSACRELLDCAERQIDSVSGSLMPGPVLADVDRLLDSVQGALRLLCVPDLPQQVEDVRARLRSLHGDEPEHGALEELALAWVTLSHRIALLPWDADWQGQVPVASEPWPPTAVTEPLADTFLREASQLLAQLRSALLPDAGSLQPDGLATALHASHTLAGCSSTMGLQSLARLALALESALERTADLRADAADTGLLADTLDGFDRLLAQFAASGVCGDVQGLLDRLAAHGVSSVAGQPADSPANDPRTCLPPPTPCVPEDFAGCSGTATAHSAEPAGDAGDAQPAPPAETSSLSGAAKEELLQTFSEEAADLLPRLEQALQSWRDSPDDRTDALAMLRLLHTLKGSARMAGLMTLGEELHHCEAEIGAMTQPAMALTAEQFDRLQARIDGWRHGCLHGARADHEPAMACAEDAGNAAPGAALAPLLPPVAAVAVPASDSVPRAMLRVRADLIERLADAGAGLWVGHARIADGVQQQRRTAADLADNLVRLRAQLRELEIDTESRILSGVAPADPAGFDPLELDRYTRLHEITRMIAESVIDLTDLQRGLMRHVEGMSQASDAQARELRRLQSEVQSARSQPFSTLEPRLRQVLRQAAREAGRDVLLVVEGGAAEVERTLLDRLSGPIEHLLRNALVHGIEPPEHREAIGKPRAGRVVLTVRPSATELQLELADDGRGLDYERIRARAESLGLLAADAPADCRHLSDLIFRPGFSTASEVTALSGRGIGLDAVHAEVQALGGRVGVDSSPGQGCRFSLSVPLSLATLPVLLVSAGRHRIALPAARLQQLLQLRPDQMAGAADGPQLHWQGQLLPMVRLAQMLGEPVSGPTSGVSVTVAILHDGERRMALELDAVDGQRELVVRSPGPQLSRAPGLVGASLLGDGSIALIVDPFRLRVDMNCQLAAPVPADTRPLVMVVDDSLTVRRASQRMLERHGFAVMLARDGVEALERLREALPAALLLDIEMPRMDGFELLSALRDDARLRELPVVMITSRIADRHRERAQQLGASAYLGKPYQEEELIGLLSGLCSAQRAAA